MGGLSAESDGEPEYYFRESGEGQRMVTCDKVFSGDGFTAACVSAVGCNPVYSPHRLFCSRHNPFSGLLRQRQHKLCHSPVRQVAVMPRISLNALIAESRRCMRKISVPIAEKTAPALELPNAFLHGVRHQNLRKRGNENESEEMSDLSWGAVKRR